jgi:hypothetical protein
MEIPLCRAGLFQAAGLALIAAGAAIIFGIRARTVLAMLGRRL